MKRKKDKIRKALFDKFSSNLHLICEENNWITIPPELEGKTNSLYLCPLCANNFYDFDLNQSIKNPLSIEHVPPESVGGKPIVLTCKTCNNDAGANLDFHIKKYMELESLTHEKTDLWAQVKFNDFNKFKSKFQLNRNQKLLKFNISKKSEYALRKLDELKVSKMNFSLQAELEFGNTRLAEKGILRAAYLYAFSKLGYSYLLSVGGKYIQSELLKKSDEKVKTFITTENLPMNEEGIFYCSTENKNRAYFVILNLKFNSEEKGFGILIPGPTLESIYYYQNCNHNSLYQVEIERIPNQDITRKPFSHLKYFAV